MLKLNKNFSGARLFIFSIIFTALFALSLTFIVPLPQSINPPLSTVVKYSDGSIARVYLARDQQWRIYKKTDSLNKHLLESILEKEDRFFYYHPGVNPIALLKAFYRFIKNGRVINGGSTITMQLARIIEPKPRTFFSKFLEILRAFQYEIRFSKKEILQMYLNYAPFGGNIVGFETASLYYFSKPTEELKLAEAATLANLPQIPGVDFFENKELLLQKRNFLLRRLEKKNKISSKEFEKAFNSTIDIEKNSFPMDIPHVSDYFYLKGRGKSYQTTIDRGLQKFVEAKIENYRKSLENKGITNASVVLLENNSGKVLAAAGSVDYFNSPQGQVRGFKAPRQTGSTLKPFLYALALEKGIITPRTMLKDVPVSYSDFEPYNFDKKFRGLVTAEEALSHSYNVPFVRLLQSTGKDNFLEFLKDGGVSSLKENSHYGLSVILGACDINLLEISNLYRMLADGGMYSPYYMSKDEIVS
ncbi:MAG: penicillin-binding protein 1C, partial [Elusimicrobiota bacterium]